MHLVEHALVVGVGVDRGHEATLDPDEVVQNLGDGREAVGGAAGVGDDQVVARQHIVVHTEDHGLQVALRGGGDKHALGTGVEVRLGSVDRLEEPGAFEHDVHAHLAVRQLARLTLAGDGDLLAVHDQRIAVDIDRAGEATMGRIELEQQRIGARVGQIVDRHQFEVVIGPLQNRPRDKPPDAPETVDCNLGRHDVVYS